MRKLTIACMLILPLAPAIADEKTVELKKAPGVERVTASCSTCHSLDYIEMNSPFLSAMQWDAEVNKMIRVMGAPIEDADARAISEYLKKNYGGG
jgi:hypothetical protein